MAVSQTESLRVTAANERSKAEQSTLPLVRERYLRSAEAWDAMASQAELIDRLNEANSEGRIKYAYQRSRSAT